jgi:hypothetical protein
MSFDVPLLKIKNYLLPEIIYILDVVLQFFSGSIQKNFYFQLVIMQSVQYILMNAISEQENDYAKYRG